MFRARALFVFGLALVIVVALVWCQVPTAVGPPDDGKERTLAERIVGSWTLIGTDGRLRGWWQSDRIEYRADGTYRTLSNYPLNVVWVSSRQGRYEVNGQVVRHHY